MASFSKGTSFSDGVTGDVTAAKLHALVDAATPVSGLVTDRTAKTSVISTDVLLISDSADSNNLKKVTVANMANNLPTAVITDGTVTTLNSTTATATNLVATTANITTGTVTGLRSTTGTISTLTSSTANITNLPGAVTGGTYSGNVIATAGTVTTLTASTANVTNLPGAVTGGTFSGNVIATAGTVTTLTASTGTITTLTTTLAGDFSISSGTGTLGTSGVTAGTYGTSTAVPRITVDTKGRITSVSTHGITTGKILQVVSSTYSTEFSQTANGYDDTGLAASITPSGTSSRVFVSVMQPVYITATTRPGGSINCVRTIGTTSSTIFSPANQTMVRTSGTEMQVIYSMGLLDSPSTVSQVTYKTQSTRNGSTNFTTSLNSIPATMVLMEVST